MLQPQSIYFTVAGHVVFPPNLSHPPACVWKLKGQSKRDCDISALLFPCVNSFCKVQYYICLFSFFAQHCKLYSRDQGYFFL